MHSKARCGVWTFHEDNPDKNIEVVRVNKNQFTVLDGVQDQVFSVEHQTTTYSKVDR